MSVDFDPVRLGPRRRRIDPVIVGAIGVVVAIAVAGIKPWDQKPAATSTPAPAVALVAPSPSATRVPTTAPPTPTASPEPVMTPSWADVDSAITSRDAWGVRAITVDQRLYKPATGSLYHERWSAATTSAGMDTATVGQSGDPVSMLGFTSPLAEQPRDVRIWRVHRGDRLEWIDAVPIATQPTEASLLFVRPLTDRGTLTPWDPGRYQVDILLDNGIHRLSVLVPDTRGAVPPLDTWVPGQPGTIPARASDPSVIRRGLFATVNGGVVALLATQTRTLDEDEAWLAVDRSPNDPVATAYLPRATGLGVMLTPQAMVARASIRQLAPDGAFEAPKPYGGISSDHGRTPYVLFAAPGDSVWAPGVYAISIDWSDGAGAHQATWHVELRPGAG